MRLAAAELSAQMLGICCDCILNIGGIAIKCHIFVCEAADYDCQLGTPFEVAARLQSIVTNDGARWYRILSQDGHKSVQYCGARGDEPRNQADIYTVSAGEDTVEVEMEGSVLRISVDESIVGCGQIVDSVEELLSKGLRPEIGRASCRERG